MRPMSSGQYFQRWQNKGAFSTRPPVPTLNRMAALTAASVDGRGWRRPSYAVAAAASGLQRWTDLPSMLMPAGVCRREGVETTV